MLSNWIYPSEGHTLELVYACEQAKATDAWKISLRFTRDRRTETETCLSARLVRLFVCEFLLDSRAKRTPAGRYVMERTYAQDNVCCPFLSAPVDTCMNGARA